MFLIKRLFGFAKENPKNSKKDTSWEEFLLSEKLRFQNFLFIALSKGDQIQYYKLVQSIGITMPSFEEALMSYLQDPLVQENSKTSEVHIVQHEILYKLWMHLIEMYGPDFEIKGLGPLIKIIEDLINLQESRV